MTLSPLWAATTGPESEPGQGAPALTQEVRTAISLAGSLPLGGYVKMLDEREGPVARPDLPVADRSTFADTVMAT